MVLILTFRIIKPTIQCLAVGAAQRDCRYWTFGLKHLYSLVLLWFLTSKTNHPLDNQSIGNSMNEATQVWWLQFVVYFLICFFLQTWDFSWDILFFGDWSERLEHFIIAVCSYKHVDGGYEWSKRRKHDNCNLLCLFCNILF